MKIKKYIGKTINGFKILDSYGIILPSGKKTRKVLLECENCGRIFERQAGVDFEHIKCKCMCKYLKPKKQKYHFIEWQGKRYTETDFCKMHNILVGTFKARIKSGMSIEESIQKEFVCKCEICDKEFISKRPNIKFCSKTCYRRKSKGRGRRKEKHIAICVVCGKEFETYRDDAKTCSKFCRQQRDRLIRNGRYYHLKEIGMFDESVTLLNVYNKFNGICVGCGDKLTFDCEAISNKYPSIDHIIPLSKNGTHTWNNVQLMCRICNCMKSDNI